MLREKDKNNFARVIIEEVVIEDLYVLTYQNKTIRADTLYNQYSGNTILTKGKTTFNLRQVKTKATRLNKLFQTNDFSYRKI